MQFEVVERYDGLENVVYKTDDRADALETRDWHRDQWADQVAARECVFVRRAS